MVGRVTAPSASFISIRRPAWLANVSVVSAVIFTTASGPAVIKPRYERTGPEKVGLAIIKFLLTKVLP